MPKNNWVKKNFAYIGPILKKNTKDLYFFQIGFNNKEHAQFYKDMFTWQIVDDNYKIDQKMGVFDNQSLKDHTPHKMEDG
jgi:hypothetical protein